MVRSSSGPRENESRCVLLSKRNLFYHLPFVPVFLVLLVVDVVVVVVVVAVVHWPSAALYYYYVSVTLYRMVFVNTNMNVLIVKMIVAFMMLLGMMAVDTMAFGTMAFQRPRGHFTTLSSVTSQNSENGRSRKDSPDRLTVVECGLKAQTETQARFEIETKETLAQIVKSLSKLDEKFDKKFDVIDKRFDAIDKKFDKKFDAIDMKTNLILLLVIVVCVAFGKVNLADIFGAVTSVVK
jgi:hypothetical protein